MSLISNTQSEIKIPLITSEDEYIIKDYNAAKIKKPSKGEAHVALTNKRALIYYWTNDGILVNDAGISDILATSVFWAKRHRRKAGITLLSVGIILLITSIISSSNFFMMMIFAPLITILFPISIFIIGLGIYLIIRTRYTFVVDLYVRTASGAISLTNFGANSSTADKIFGRFLSPSQIRLEGTPGPDAELMAKEIGATLLDIQRGIMKKR